nr:hypothetical protein [Tanacetum cinerariifolium]
MAAGSRDRPSMLATGRYPQWRSRFLRYIDTRPNGEALRKCILSGPYKPTTVLVQAIEATDNSLIIPEHTTVETPMNMSPENKAHFLAEKEAIHLILTGIGDQIYSTMDAFQTAQEMWEAIERLQQGESLNIQDVKTNLFWEFGKFTSHDGETIESYYTRFYKLMNEMIRNNFIVATMQVNVKFLQQLQLEWSRYKGKEIAKPITPPSEKTSKEDNDPEQAQRDKGMQKAEKEKMLLCKQAEQGVPLQTEQYDWLADTDEEVDEQEMEADYSYMAKIQEVPTADTVEANDSNVIPDSPDMCEDAIQNNQNDIESDDERVALANLITNLKLDVDENKKIQKQLKKENTTHAQELKECNAILVETKIVDNAWIKHSKDQFHAPTAQDMEILIQTCLKPVATKTQNDSFRFVHELKQEMHADLKYVESLEKEIDELKSDKAEFLNMYDVILQECVSNDVVNHKTNVSRPHHKNNQLRDKVLPNNSQVKLKKTQVEVHPRIPSVSNKMKSVTACKDSLNSRTLNANHMTNNLKLLCNFVEKSLGTVRFGNDQFVPILGYGDLVQGNVTINKGNDLLIRNRGSDLYTISLQESTSSTLLCLMAKASQTHAWLWHLRLSHLNFDYINLLSKKDIVIGLPKLKYVKD